MVKLTKEKNLLDYFNNNELAASVWKDKYSTEGEVTPDDMHLRMAKEFARVIDDPNYSVDFIFKLFKDFKYVVPQGSIMSMLGNKNKIGSLSNCLSGDVPVLTRQGWVPIRDLAGEFVEIMTKGGSWTTAPFKSYGKQKTYVITLSNGIRQKEIRATMDHRWPLYSSKKPDSIHTIKTTSELEPGDTLYSTYGKSRTPKTFSSVGIAHGISYGDGQTVRGRGNSNSITLCADSRVLGKYFPDSYVSSDENLCEGGSDYYSGLPNFFRELPPLSENKAYLWGWLSGYFAADGHIDNRGACMINSSKKEDIKFVQNVCGVLGIGCGPVLEQTSTSNLTGKDHTMYKCFIPKSHLTEGFFLLDKHKERYSPSDKSINRWKVVSVDLNNPIVEEVFCAEVPKTESFVIEDNILSMNCFVVPSPQDSYSGILYTDEQLAQLMKRRGGVGVDISTLRPEGEAVLNAAGTSTGAYSFMERFSNTTREVAQSGRRGALMLTIDIRHPDSTHFINIKQDRTKVTGANVSVMLRDEFMEAVESGDLYLQHFPCHITPQSVEKREDGFYLGGEKMELNLNYKTPDNFVVRVVNAKDLYKNIVHNAWDNAEPGQMFVDRHWNYSTDGVYPEYRGVTSNPCGEIFMGPFDACRLIASNLFSYVVNAFYKDAYFDMEEFYKNSYHAQIIADAVVTLELEHIDRIINKIKSDPEPDHIKVRELNLWENVKKITSSGRRTGSGFTGLGDTLAALNIEYGSQKSIDFLDGLMRTKFKAELDASIDLAKKHGPFKGWDPYLEKNDFFKMIEQEFPEQFSKMQKYGRRNVSWSTVAPTGSVSILTQTSSGLEPMFMPFYTRRRKINPSEKGYRVDFVDQNGDKWMEYPVFEPRFKQWLQIRVKDVHSLSKEEVNEWFTKSPWYGSCANDIDWISRVKIQSVIQKYTTHSISSTINLPNDFLEEEVYKIYMMSWKLGLKGVTIYRDGCRTGVLVSNTEQKPKFTPRSAPKRPKELPADVYHVTANGRRWTVCVGLLDGNPYEVFASPVIFGKHNSSGTIKKLRSGIYSLYYGDELVIEHVAQNNTGEEQALTRTLSGALRHGMKIDFAVAILKKNDTALVSFSKAVARTLAKYTDSEETKEHCPECNNSSLIREEGCLKCPSCGYSKC